jgi:dipeptidase
MPASYMVDGRREFRRDAAWWAFRQASKLSYIRWQEIRGVTEAVWKPLEEEYFARQAEVEQQALALYKTDPARAEAFLTDYSHRLANAAVERYWKLSEEIWARFNNVF